MDGRPDGLLRCLRDGREIPRRGRADRDGAGVAAIAFDFVTRAQAHADTMRRYLDLAVRLSLVRDQIACDVLTREWIAKSGDEPALYGNAMKIAHNAAIVSLQRDAPPLELTNWARWTGAYLSVIGPDRLRSHRAGPRVEVTAGRRGPARR